MNRRDFVAAAAALPFALRAGTALAGGTPLVLVTEDDLAHIAAVEISSGRIHRRIPTVTGPRSIESVGQSAIVAHWSSGAISILDAPTLSVRHVLRTFAEPRYTVSSRDGRFGFVTDSGHGDLVTVDVQRGRVVARVHLGAWPRHLAIDPSGRALWVALGSEARELAVVDVSRPERPRIAARIVPPFLAHDIGFDPGGRHAWVTSGDRGAIAVYDVRGRHVVAQLAAHAAPQHVEFLGGNAYVTSGAAGTVRVHARGDGSVRRTTAVPVGSYNVQQGWGQILTPSLATGTLSVLDGRGALLRRVHVAPSTHDACFAMSA